MRKDMKDLLLNTGRHGGGGKSAMSRRARLKRMNDEDIPNWLPTARHRQYGWDAKELGDRLAPLVGFLDKNCGRPWDEVYSEICEHADMRSIRGYHLRTHVWNEVVPNNYDVGHRRRYGPFFVDPDGLLQREAPYVRKPRSRWGKDNPRYRVDANLYYEKIEGFWYLFQTKHWSQPNSREDLVEKDGQVEIVKTVLPDVWHHETTKHQVCGKVQKILDDLFI